MRPSLLTALEEQLMSARRYRPVLKAAGLGTPEAISGVSTCGPARTRWVHVWHNKVSNIDHVNVFNCQFHRGLTIV